MKSLIISVTFFGSLLSHAQNLVPNGNFESFYYDGGSNPIDFYSGTYTGNWWADLTNSSTHHRFDNAMQGTWYVAKAEKTYGGKRRDSPDWIDPNLWYNTENDGNCTETKYVRCAYPTESIMVKLDGGHKLIKGQTYTFKVKARGGEGTNFPSHEFRLAFTADNEGLYCINKKKWFVKEFYLVNSCSWQYLEYTFTVPTDDDKKYEDMQWLVLNVNYYRNGSKTPNDFKAVYNFDDVVLTMEPKCIDHRYIQDRVYAHDEHKIEQANVEIRAGAHVSPYSWPENNPVVVKSTAMVIYRAPTVYLEPGFFIEEDGSYFDTQVGTCVDDPCPPVPSFIPPPIVHCDTNLTLGNELPETQGVFYTWEPANYFTAPWSRVTGVNPPPNVDDCINAKLTAWTICGASQVYHFQLRFINAAPMINVANVSMNETGITGQINLQNATSYTIQGYYLGTNQLVFENDYAINCGNGILHIPLNIDHCTGNLCKDLTIVITASNPCFGSASQTLTWYKPIIPNYNIQINNLVSTDFAFNFDWQVPETYEYVKIQVWNEAKTEMICENVYDHCNNPLNTLSPFHYDIRNCLGDGCFAQCKNYKIVLEAKQFCNDYISNFEIAWNKSNTNFAMPVNYPNIITADNNGINDELCFYPTGADWYSIFVKNRWGNTMYYSSGCVNTSPICLWHPSSNVTDGVYFYTIQFGNQCNYSDQITVPVTVFSNSLLPQNNTFDDQNQLVNKNEVLAYPNPTNDFFQLASCDGLQELSLVDQNGTLVKQFAPQEIYDISELVAGIYTLILKLKNDENKYFKMVKL